MYSLPVLEARIPISRCPRGHVLSGGSGGNPLPLPASRGPWCSLASGSVTVFTWPLPSMSVCQISHCLSPPKSKKISSLDASPNPIFKDPFLQIRSQSQVLELRTWTYFWEVPVQPTTIDDKILNKVG